MELRLQKYFTDCGVLSRRAAESEIAAGHVRVNGNIAVTGQKIDPERDIVLFRGQRVEPSADAHGIYIMLNKPRGYVTTLSDEKGRHTISELVADVGQRVYPVGRLDMDSDGLLLLTNDGELANFLTHPRHGIPKIYHVKVRGIPTADKLRELGQPVEIDGLKTKPVTFKLISTDEGSSATLETVLFEGRNRQIRRMCEQRDVEILRLTRIAVGEIRLSDLAPGKWRRLTRSQVQYLRSAMAEQKPKKK